MICNNLKSVERPDLEATQLRRKAPKIKLLKKSVRMLQEQGARQRLRHDIGNIIESGDVCDAELLVEHTLFQKMILDVDMLVALVHGFGLGPLDRREIVRAN